MPNNKRRASGDEGKYKAPRSGRPGNLNLRRVGREISQVRKTRSPRGRRGTLPSGKDMWAFCLGPAQRAAEVFGAFSPRMADGRGVLQLLQSLSGSKTDRALRRLQQINCPLG